MKINRLRYNLIVAIILLIGCLANVMIVLLMYEFLALSSHSDLMSLYNPQLVRCTIMTISFKQRYE